MPRLAAIGRLSATNRLASASRIAVAGVPPDTLTGLVLWLKADAITGLADGAAVASWLDSSGAGNSVSQGTSADQPTYQTSVLNGKPALHFNGTSYFLSRTTGFPINSDYTIAAVFRASSFTPNNVVLGGTTGEALYLQGTAMPRLYENGTFAVAPTAMALNTFAVVSGIFTDATLRGAIRVNQGVDGTGTATQHNADANIQIGAFAGANFLNGDIAEIVVYSRALSVIERANVETYLAAKYALGKIATARSAVV